MCCSRVCNREGRALGKSGRGLPQSKSSAISWRIWQLVRTEGGIADSDAVLLAEARAELLVGDGRVHRASRGARRVDSSLRDWNCFGRAKGFMVFVVRGK